MKKYIYTIGIFILAWGTQSCSDYLSEKSETGYTDVDLYNSAENIERTALAMYDYQRSLSSKPDDTNGLLGTQIWGERQTDLVIFTTGGDASIGRYTDMTPSGGGMKMYFSRYWEHCYFMIERANKILHYGAEFGDAAKRARGEAAFWRAYNYYSLWSRYGAVYLNTEPVDGVNIGALNYTRASKEDVFKQIHTDLDQAISELPLKEDPKDPSGRLTQDAAHHIKALAAAWQGDWALVLKQVEIVDKNKVHTMVKDVSQVFDRSNFKDHPEALLFMHYSKDRGGATGHRQGSQYINVAYEYSYTWTGNTASTDQYNAANLGRNWGLAFPNTYMMSLYKEGDKRLDVYYNVRNTYQNPNNTKVGKDLVLVPPAELKTDKNTGIKYYTTTNHTDKDVVITLGSPIHGRDIGAAYDRNNDGTVKMKDGKPVYRAKPAHRQQTPSSIKRFDRWEKPIGSDTGVTATNDIMLFRVTETFMLGAEAAVMLGDQATARKYYNMTWTRAGNTAETGTITFDMIRDEQARELSFEGRRWDFLKRHNIWYTQMRSYAGDFTTYPTTLETANLYNKETYGVSDGRDIKFKPNPDYYEDFSGGQARDVELRFTIQPFHENWPVPQDQLDLMPSFGQTQGY